MDIQTFSVSLFRRRTFLAEEVLVDMPFCQMVVIDSRHHRQLGDVPHVRCKGSGRQWIVGSTVGAV